MDQRPPQLYSALVAGAAWEQKSETLLRPLAVEGITAVMEWPSPTEIGQLLATNLVFVWAVSWADWAGEVELGVVQQDPLGRTLPLHSHRLVLRREVNALIYHKRMEVDLVDGLHWFEFSLDGTVSASIPLRVHYR